MILKQYYLGCLSHASYLIGDEETGTAVVVDPQRDVEQYLADAETAGLSIRHVLLTHFHADFVSGHVELRQKVGASIHVGAPGRAEYEIVPMLEGEPLVMGKVRIEFLATPGHTPESTSIVVYDLATSDSIPHAVLTGDTLFIGDVGRPDLLASVGVTAAELASMLYDSLHEKLLQLPDETLVYPAHGAGSMCGKNLSTETVSTIGDQRRLNYALQPMSKEEFVAQITVNQPPVPRYFAFDAGLNKKERRTLEEAMEGALAPLGLDEVLRRANAGAQILDTRNADVFADGHLQGSINVGLDGKYATYCGSVLHNERSILLVTDPGMERQAAMRLGRIGYDNVAGYLEGGPAAFGDRPELRRSSRRINPEELSSLLSSDAAPAILDVRQPGEWEAGHMAGSVNIPLGQLEERLGELPPARPILVHCQSGVRSSTACSLLASLGVDGLIDLAGGFCAWSDLAEQATAGSAPGGADTA